MYTEEIKKKFKNPPPPPISDSDAYGMWIVRRVNILVYVLDFNSISFHLLNLITILP